MKGGLFWRTYSVIVAALLITIIIFSSVLVAQRQQGLQERYEREVRLQAREVADYMANLSKLSYVQRNSTMKPIILNKITDIYQKYNLRAKIDAKLNRFMRVSNNTTFYNSTYNYPGMGDVNEGMGYAARHAMASFPLQNPDGTWTYVTDWIRGNYRIANGRHTGYASDNLNVRRRTDFANTSELTITPVKQFNLKANFTYRFYQNRYTHRRNEIDYSSTPGVITHYSNTGAYENWMSENIATYNYMASNVYGTYEDTFADAHHLTLMAGFNWETNRRKTVYARGYDLITEEVLC